MLAELEKIVEFLKENAGEGDMASVQINSDGKAVLRVGLSEPEPMSLEWFVFEVNGRVV